MDHGSPVQSQAQYNRIINESNYDTNTLNMLQKQSKYLNISHDENYQQTPSPHKIRKVGVEES
jgi:hypothetical protein